MMHVTLQDMSLAAKLSVLHETWIEPVDGGFKIKETEDNEIFVLRMIYNWRIARGPKNSLGYDRGWCYYGTDVVTLLRAVKAAVEWDGKDDTAPGNWDKNAMTGEYNGQQTET